TGLPAAPRDPGPDGRQPDPRDRPRPARGRSAFVGWFLWIVSLPVIAVAAMRAAPDDGLTPVAQGVPFVPYAVVAAAPLLVLAVTARRYVLSSALILCVALGGFVAAKAFFPATQQVADAEPGTP